MREKKAREKEREKRSVRDWQGAWWIPSFEVDNEIIYEIKPWLYLIIASYVI